MVVEAAVDRIALLCSLSFVAGAAVTWMISKAINSADKIETQSKIELNLLKEAFDSYKQQTQTYFTRATQLVEEVQFRVHSLQELLFSAGHALRDTPQESELDRADYAVAKAVLDRAQSAELGVQHFKKGI